MTGKMRGRAQARSYEKLSYARSPVGAGLPASRLSGSRAGALLREAVICDALVGAGLPATGAGNRAQARSYEKQSYATLS
jgi:hypothetical protein